MNDDDLTNRQKEVVDTDAPTVIVLGGAGTGKTTTALFAAMKELEDRSEAHQRVLFLTFSRTAVAQILDRAGPIFEQVGGRVEILTFHGFAYRLAVNFGRYGGLGLQPPVLVGESEAAMGAAGDALRFGDLLPLALRLFGSSFVKSLLAERWSLIICDEFQDTGDEHWKLLENLAPPARLLLLADPHQMIYDGFLPGVGSHRLELAEARSGARVIKLEQASQRDPSQVLPAAAAKIRQRLFETPEVERAVAEDRLQVVAGVAFDEAPYAIRDIIHRSRDEGDRSFGVYTHGNGPAAQLSVGLTKVGVENIPVGFPESYGQSLAAMVEALRYIHGQCDWVSVEFRLAVLVTSFSRAKKPPALALMLAGRRARSRELQEVLDELEADCVACSRDDPSAAATLAANLWPRFGVTQGRRVWRRAQEAFVMVVAANSRFDSDHRLALVAASVEAQRMTSYVDIDGGGRHPVQVMNLHQTKGREADGTILVFRDGEYFGREREPFEANSRLLYVALTRARNRVTLVLGHKPHSLVAPFEKHAKSR